MHTASVDLSSGRCVLLERRSSEVFTLSSLHPLRMSWVELSNLEGKASGDTAMALLIFSMFHCPSFVAA